MSGIDFQEIEENLEKIEAALLAYEAAVSNGTDDAGMLHFVFRYAHNLKSSLAMVGFRESSSLIHAVETYFDALRNGRRTPSPWILSLCLEVVDLLGQNVRSGNEGPGPVQALSGRFEAAVNSPDDGKPVKTTENKPPISLTRPQMAVFKQALKDGVGVYLLEKIITTSLPEEFYSQLPCWEDIGKVGSVLAWTPQWAQLPKTVPETVLKVLFTSEQSHDVVRGAISDPLRVVAEVRAKPIPIQVVNLSPERLESLPPDFSYGAFSSMEQTGEASAPRVLLYWAPSAVEASGLLKEPQRGPKDRLILFLDRPCEQVKQVVDLCVSGVDILLEGTPSQSNVRDEIQYLLQRMSS